MFHISMLDVDYILFGHSNHLWISQNTGHMPFAPNLLIIHFESM